MNRHESLMADFDLDAVVELAKESGELAESYFGKVSAMRKADSTLVTEADHAKWKRWFAPVWRK